MNRVARTIIFSALVWVVSTLMMTQACREDGDSYNSDGDKVDKIAAKMSDRLGDKLEGQVSKWMSGYDGSEMTDGDVESEEEDTWSDEECCLLDDPCSMSGDYICQCPEMEWDYLDCGSSGGAVCAESFDVCAPSGGEDLPENYNLGEVELGWYKNDPPQTSNGPDSLLCFESPVVLEDENSNTILFGFDPYWNDVAALVLVLKDVEGYGLLPIDNCGQVEFPGSSELCADLNNAEVWISARAALYTFESEAGSYLDFDIKIICPSDNFDVSPAWEGYP